MVEQASVVLEMVKDTHVKVHHITHHHEIVGACSSRSEIASSSYAGQMEEYD